MDKKTCTFGDYIRWAKDNNTNLLMEVFGDESHFLRLVTSDRSKGHRYLARSIRNTINSSIMFDGYYYPHYGMPVDTGSAGINDYNKPINLIKQANVSLIKKMNSGLPFIPNRFDCSILRVKFCVYEPVIIVWIGDKFHSERRCNGTEKRKIYWDSEEVICQKQKQDQDVQKTNMTY